MTLIELLIFAVVCVLAVWLLRQLPLPSPIGLIVKIVVVGILLLYLLQRVGIIPAVL
jgi:hypothetical protein